MANYSLVANSKFQPFSYQELAAPVMEMSNYHEMLNQEYDKLSTQADVLEAMGENDRDKNSKSYNQYKAYSDSLRKEADDLYKFGLNVESRRRLSDLRRRYNTDIVPIQNAWTKREKEADEQMKATLQNPSVMFTRDAANTSLDDYVKNPLGGYGVISGANITAQMAGMAKNLAKQILTDPDSAKKMDIDPDTYAYIERHGLDENIIRNWENYPTLKRMYEQVMRANGVTEEALANSTNRKHILDQSRGYAEMGMWEAMGDDKMHILENFRSRERFKAAMDVATYRQKKTIDNSYSMPTTPPSPYPAVSQDMPLILGDADDRKKSEKLAVKLGFSAGGGNGKYSKTLKGSLFDAGTKGIIPSTYAPVSKRPDGREVNGMRLFDPKTNKMMTKKQFMNQAGSNAKNRASLGTWYDNNVVPALEHFGFNHNDTPSSLEFEKAYKNRYNSGAAGYITGIDISHDNAEDWRKLGSSNAYAIKSYNRTTGMIPSSNAVKLGTILDKVKKNEGNINKTILTNYQGEPALLFEYMEGKNTINYQVPVDMGNAMIRRAVEHLIQADEASNLANDDRFRDTEIGIRFAQQAEDLMEAGLGDMNNFLITYKKPSVNTYKQPTDKQIEE